jgi:hypothetical protein
MLSSGRPKGLHYDCLNRFDNRDDALSAADTGGRQAAGLAAATQLQQKTFFRN